VCVGTLAGWALLGRYSNPGFPEYETGELTPTPRRSVGDISIARVRDL
jgi:hypothetical protein